MIDHQDAWNCEQELDTLATVDPLNMQIFQLKGSVLALEQQKSHSFRTGYDGTYIKHETLNARYIASPKKPKAGIECPGWAALVGSAAVEVVVGAAIQ